MSQVTYKSWTKGIDTESDPPRHSPNWALSRRGWFKVFDDRVECGDWIIPASDIHDAVLYEARQWWLIPVMVLSISTTEGTWQFGFNPWSRVASALPFPFRRERLRLAFSLAGVHPRAWGLLIIAIVLLWLGSL